MGDFTLARFSDGTQVLSCGWWAPSSGQEVWLVMEVKEKSEQHILWVYKQYEAAKIAANEAESACVSYTWPRSRRAGQLALYHFDRSWRKA